MARRPEAAAAESREPAEMTGLARRAAQEAAAEASSEAVEKKG